MRTIWKYELEITDKQVKSIPKDANILDIQVRQTNAGFHIEMWAQVDTDNLPVDVTIRCFGTGHQIPEDPGEYIATVKTGGLVWHFFEVVE